MEPQLLLDILWEVSGACSRDFKKYYNNLLWNKKSACKHRYKSSPESEFFSYYKFEMFWIDTKSGR